MAKKAKPAKAKSPAKKSTTPAKKSDPAAKKSTAPAKKSEPAAKKSTAPAKKSEPAAKKSTTPAKKSPAAEKSKPAAKKSKLAVIKTIETAASVEGFINSIPDEQKRKDSFSIMEMMKKATGEKPKMWGSSIIGFGNRIYKSPNTDREVEWFYIGFSPRKANLTVYLLNMQKHADALKKLGKYKIGGGCLYINKLEDVDVKVLKGMIDAALKLNK